MAKLLLIDTYNFLHRAYHALPKTFKDQNGEPTNAVYGVTSMLITVLNELKPTYVVAAMDGEKPTFRLENFTGYKAHRKPTENDLTIQIPKVKEILEGFGITQILIEGYEADDIIGTLATKYGKDDMEVIIVSNDRDLWQLINKNVLVMLPTTTGAAEWIGEKEVVARMGFVPKQMIDYKSLRGDPSDNIPGVFGIGEKTAKELISKYGNLETIYRNIDSITPESVKIKLANCAEQAVMSKQLATIETAAPFSLALKDCKYSEFNKLKLAKILSKYNFKSLIKRLGLDPADYGLPDGKSVKKEPIPENQLSLL